MRITKWVSTLGLASMLLLTACSGPKELKKDDFYKESKNSQDGVYYEIFLRAFADSDNDGIGDLNGATQKLDYLKELGIQGIWLMPVNPSPSYHGYDVTDYKEINPDYGTFDDFKTFVEEAHKRDIKVLIDLVANHTSKEHPWFQKALKNDPIFKDYYVWDNGKGNIDTNTPGEWGQTVWHNAETGKYEGIFWDGMPDLNFDNKAVRDEMINIGKYWLEKTNVDGFRLDAAKHIYSKPYIDTDEEKDHLWWKEFHQAMKEVNPNVMLVGEVWDTADIVAPYLKDGLTSTFNFDISEKIISTVSNESDAGIAIDLERTREYFKSINPNFIDSVFITNHDMDRIMSQVDGDANKAKMAASILLTIPGNPFIYYGEEIGMFGVKPDEHIREPFVWSEDESQSPNTRWIQPFENTDRKNLAADKQINDKDSVYNHYKKLIYARRANEALIKGDILSSPIDKEGLVIFERIHGKKTALVVHNVTGKPLQFDLNEKFFESYSEYKSIFFRTSEKNTVKNKVITLNPYSTIILEKK